jgi:hypothetical protein
LTVIEDDEEAMNECSPDLPLDRWQTEGPW